MGVAHSDGPVLLEPFAPGDLTHAVALELVESAAEKGIWLDSAIDPATPPRARGDAAGIRRALRTLARRALAATQRGHIAVSLTARFHEPGRCTLVFSITDTAPGLTAEQCDALARRLPPHLRLGCEALLKGGNRLQLAVAVEPMEAPESPKDRLERLATWARDRGGRILVVDDSATNRIITAALLRKAGFEAVPADGGAEALRLAATEPFDAVLMDVAMPDLDGLAATAAIRALDGTRARLPVIAMTAHAFPEDRERCLNAGMDDYLAKPFRTLDLLEALARRLG